ncbi:Uncharacterized membrane protein [Pseudarthrobacter equi]|uniref:Uncharacterized membrane protein n=1 Tax=Pseudarthrobacter equi TaxID=728066 RepID=A0A1H1VWQ1_9MICC|nr:hypothetical protein [Pseudarthrobacter equi]SDS89172.1 Uncharacterized membrane protein [Pseudarthrobacter equi]
MEVNNREWALAIWLAAFLMLFLLVPASRRSVPGLLRIFFGHRIFVPFLIMVIYTGGVIAVLIGMGVWEAKLITPTIVWFLTIALINFMRVPRAMKEPRYFRKLAVSAVTVPVAVQFVVDMYPFSLISEILLQGGFLLFSAVAAFAATGQQYAAARRILNVLIGLLVVVVVIHSAHEITAQWSRIDFGGEAKKFLLPIGLTAAFLPFLYGLTLYAAYESAASHMKAVRPPKTPLARPVITLLARTAFSVEKIAAVTPRTRMVMAETSSWRAASAAFDAGRVHEITRRQELADKQQRLLDNAGVAGTDGNCKRLDQREFEQTIRALSYLHFCQAGNYRNLGRYRADLIDALGPEALASRGLPNEAAITMHVAKDGQGWWAWRRTVTGWVFAIGAIEAPNDRWEFDGPKVPAGGPGSDPSWRHFMVPPEPHEHW